MKRVGGEGELLQKERQAADRSDAVGKDQSTIKGRP